MHSIPHLFKFLATPWLLVLSFSAQSAARINPKALPITFGHVAPGVYTIGEVNSYYDPYRQIQLREGYDLQTTEVTLKQWFDVIKRLPMLAGVYSERECGDQLVEVTIDDQPKTICANLPVNDIPLVEMELFIERLNEQAKLNGELYRYRLPTEIEWEIAARAGNTESIFPAVEKDPEVGIYTWSVLSENSGFYGLLPVTTKKANPWGFFGLIGNAAEIVTYENWQLRQMAEYTIDQQYLAVAGYRSSRFGVELRVASRLWASRLINSLETGFRLVRFVPKVQDSQPPPPPPNPSQGPCCGHPRR